MWTSEEFELFLRYSNRLFCVEIWALYRYPIFKWITVSCPYDRIWYHYSEPCSSGCQITCPIEIYTLHWSIVTSTSEVFFYLGLKSVLLFNIIHVFPLLLTALISQCYLRKTSSFQINIVNVYVSYCYRRQGCGDVWQDKVVAGMKTAITSSLLCTQEFIELRKVT